MLPDYVCPQCGPDPAGAEEHARTHHTFAGLLAEDGSEVALQPCGHPVSAVVSSDEGTAYCAMCTQEPTCGIAGCVGKHYPQDHNAIIDTSTDDQSRSLFHSLQEAIRERDALRAEVERMHPVVEAALHMRDWQEQDDQLQLRYPGVVDAVTDAVNEYRKDTNDE